MYSVHVHQYEGRDRVSSSSLDCEDRSEAYKIFYMVRDVLVECDESTYHVQVCRDNLGVAAWSRGFGTRFLMD